MTWRSDFNYDEACGDDSGMGSVTYLTCSKCDAVA